MLEGWPDDEHAVPSPVSPPRGLGRGAYALFLKRVEFELEASFVG